MATTADITPAICRQLLDYDPSTGELFWRPRPISAFSQAFVGRSWNTRHAGREAFTSIDSRGYRFGTLLGAKVRAHRIAFAIHHNFDPLNVDHINGDKLDNRIVNLREVTKSENARNAKLYSNNTSGVAGVRLVGKRWVAVAGHKSTGSFVDLGHYATKEEAIAARLRYNVKHGYTERHGVAASHLPASNSRT